MGGGKGIADVLNGLIADMPALVYLVAVLSAVMGVFLAGYALMRLYQANAAADGTGLNWFTAFLLGSAMTVGSIVIAKFSFYFAD
ncbi:hypothetical protein [Methylorubrum thiocyanatum]|uniref:hypothetical protein n=1 Tax=Methylorubrum thiocyanatum TaxID=47958 RepID=UPI003F7EE830